MRLFDIALKDTLRSFRSAFMVVMMFVAPLLLTGLIYLAFGRAGSQAYALPVTRVQVANLDQVDQQAGLFAGRLLTEYLQGDEMAHLLQVSIADDEAGARAAVERREADVAVLIPAQLSAAAVDPKVVASVTLYHDPTLTIQAGIVRIVVADYLDAFSGVKIALQVAQQAVATKGGTLNAAGLGRIEEQYVAWVQTVGHAHEDDAPERPILLARGPAGQRAADNLISTMLGPVLAGMTVFFAFFTAAGSASSLLREQEEGTLARLFSTPTPRALVLGGKFVAILLILAVQVPILLLAGRLIFGIRWGAPATVVLLAVGVIVAAAGFGVFLMSLVKTARQSGPVLGLVVTLTGLLGGLIPTGDPSKPGAFATISLALPQGWAMRGWRLALNGASAGDIWLPTLVLLLAGLALLAVGVAGFRRRFA